MSSKASKILEIVKQKASMSEKVSVKDPEYAYYVGANPQLAMQMATADFMIKNKLSPDEPRLIMLKFFRSWLNQQRKALFACYVGEVSQLGLILGLKDDRLAVT